MVHPQYMLNPGDMFSIRLDKMLFATGAPKAKPSWLKKKTTAVKEEVEEEAEAGEGEEVAAAGDAEEVKVAKDSTNYPEHWTEEDIADFKRQRHAGQKGDLDRQAGGAHWMNDENRLDRYDPSAPYRTPWVPRDYLSAFAFIPRYLEVNHNTGHAVYLRHPVAMPGQSEVSTPQKPSTLLGLTESHRLLLPSTSRPCSSHTTGSCAVNRQKAPPMYSRK
jgi:ribosomal protein S4